MPPRRNAAATATSKNTDTARPVTPTPQPLVAAPAKAKLKANAPLNPAEVAQSIWSKYVSTTPQRTKLVDVFMAFLVAVGVLQFVYCVIVGNYVSASEGCEENKRGLEMGGGKRWRR